MTTALPPSDRPYPEAPATPPLAAAGTGTEPVTTAAVCDSCDAPLAGDQRYCVICGRRARHVADPALDQLQVAARRPSASARPEHATAARTVSVGTALAVALVPVAAVVGLLAGRGPDDSRLIAALQAEGARAAAAAVAGASGGSPAPTSTPAGAASVPASGASAAAPSGAYAVELSVLIPGKAGSASAVVRAAQRLGAPRVRTLAPGTVTITPPPVSGATVVVSGPYPTRAAALTALAALHHRFPAARVVRVGGPAPSAAPSGRVLTRTSLGTVHQAAGSAATAAQKAAGARIAERVSRQIGSSYTASQQGLPDQVAVP